MSLLAQRRIAVQNGGNPSFYTELDSAIIHAQAGDSIFLPGGIFQTNLDSINKTIHLIGVGHNPDSSQATGRTKILGAVILVNGADFSSFSGIYFEDELIVGTSPSNVQVSALKIDQCNWYKILLSYAFAVSSGSYGHQITRCVVRKELWGGYSTDGLIANNIFGWKVSYFASGNQFLNNIFSRDATGFGCNTFFNISFCEFRNNIILNNCDIGDTEFEDNFLSHNYIITGTGGGWDNRNELNNNLINQPFAGLFQNVGTAQFNAFYYSYDYRLASPVAQGFGTDGTDLGVYGGVFPWKEGQIPFQPHYQSVTIDPMTDGSDSLRVKIRVEAQKR
ncbi:MAG: hypothetical protein AAF399_21640 [Bacteroidota bacterium]